jgi:hypothetical protein
MVATFSLASKSFEIKLSLYQPQYMDDHVVKPNVKLPKDCHSQPMNNDDFLILKW